MRVKEVIAAAEAEAKKHSLGENMLDADWRQLVAFERMDAGQLVSIESGTRSGSPRYCRETKMFEVRAPGRQGLS